MGSFKLGGMTFGSLFKKERTWAIDPFRCVQCGTCVRVCPKHCLTMDPAYTPIATAKSCRVVHVPDPKAAVTES